jgi:predicted secreted protein
MKILIKQTDKIKNGESESLIYLMDDNCNPLECKIAYGKTNEKEIVNSMMALNGVSQIDRLSLKDFLYVKETNVAISGKHI